MVVGFCEEEVHEHCHPLDDIGIFSNTLELFVGILVGITYDYVKSKFSTKLNYLLQIWMNGELKLSCCLAYFLPSSL